MEIAGIKGLTVKVHDSDLTTSPSDLVGLHIYSLDYIPWGNVFEGSKSD